MKESRPWVLVVDDSADLRAVLSAVLSDLGFRVAQASDGLEAMTLFLQHPYELVLTDLHMPGADGFTLAKAVKDKSPHTPVVLVTGSERQSVRSRPDRDSVDCVIFKPFRLHDIERAVQFFMNVKNAWTQGENEATALT